MLQAIIPVIAKLAGTAISKAIPDKDLAAKVQAELNHSLLEYDTTELNRAADIIIAEARGESFIQRSWRPIVMLTFAALVVAHWLGLTAPELAESEVLALLDIVKIGLGGYVVGRSAEKAVKMWKSS